MGHKSAAWLGLCSDSSSLFRTHHREQLPGPGSNLQMAHLHVCQVHAGHWPGAQMGGSWVALAFLHVISLWDSLCFLTARWIGSKNKCSKTQEVETANFIYLGTETNTTSLQNAVF